MGWSRYRARGSGTLCVSRSLRVTAVLRRHVCVPEKLTLSDQSSWGNKLSTSSSPHPCQALSPRPASAPPVQSLPLCPGFLASRLGQVPSLGAVPLA